MSDDKWIVFDWYAKEIVYYMRYNDWSSDLRMAQKFTSYEEALEVTKNLYMNSVQIDLHPRCRYAD